MYSALSQLLLPLDMLHSTSVHLVRLDICNSNSWQVYILAPAALTLQPSMALCPVSV